MTDYVWSDLRDPFIERVGSTPSSDVEQRIIDVFQAQCSCSKASACRTLSATHPHRIDPPDAWHA
jgi:hypothetical protein